MIFVKAKEGFEMDFTRRLFNGKTAGSPTLCQQSAHLQPS